MNKTVELLIIALSLVAGLAAAGVFLYTNVLYKKPIPSNSIEMANFKADMKEMALSKSFKVGPLMTNLVSDNNRLRYLSLEIYIMPFYTEDLDFLQQKAPFIYDIIISTSEQMTPQELNTVSGKILYESRVKNQINDLFGKKIVKEMYFSEFMVQ